MKKRRRQTFHREGSHHRGFALPTALLLMLLISTVSISLVLVINTEDRMSGTDLDNTRAFYAAEAAMEKMVADVNRLFADFQTPTVAQIEALADEEPDLEGITFSEYVIDVEESGGVPTTETRIIKSGPYEGMMAQVTTLKLTATASALMGAEVKMNRDVLVAQIPIFQFGIFSEEDLSYFPGPNFDFGGRVHSNGNLFLATGGSSELVFHSKLTAAADVIRAELSNGLNTTTTGRTGPILIPTAVGGCDGARPSCRDLDETEGSRVGGPSSAVNSSWENLSTSVYNGMILNADTGARRLELGFVAEGAEPIEIIRRPPPAEDPGSLLSKARLYNQAQIRVLLSNDQSQLPDTGVLLANAPPYLFSGGIVVCHRPGTPAQRTKVVTPASLTPHLTHGDTMGACPGDTGGPIPDIPTDTAFAEGNNLFDGDFIPPAGLPSGDSWPLIDEYLLVQAKQGSGWANVTAEWLALGIARENPNAILKFQTLKSPTLTVSDLVDPLNSYPLNFYDAREGEVRDVSLGDGNTSCAVGGVMNAVELDVGNLKAWLSGAIGTTGNQTDSVSENGYLLYYSDRRGMASAGGGSLDGTYGFEDVINPADPAGAPNGSLDPAEDVNGNGVLDVHGGSNLGRGFGVADGDPTIRIDCLTLAKKNRVSGARRVLKLVNGGLGNVPTRPDGSGGFTVGSENPVYIQGNYNANTDSFGEPHAAAAVIADAVTLLSNSWDDWNSLEDPTYIGSSTLRAATTTSYRVAIAAGKNFSWPHPEWTAVQDYGLDGGTHNFLRYLERWSGETLHYLGSLVSLYPSEYGLGIFKCCETVYSPPTRDYKFDTEFVYPEKLPPATPRFRDLVNLHFHQILAPE